MHSSRSRWAFIATALILSVSTASAAPPDAKEPKRAAKPDVKQLARIGGFSESVTSLAYSPDGKLLVAGTFEQVKLIDLASNKVVATLPVNSGEVKAVAFSPDGKLLAIGSYQAASLWDVATRKLEKSLDAHTSYVTGAVFSPDGMTLATSSEDQSIRFWDVATGQPGLVIREHRYPVHAIAFSPDGKQLASAAGDIARVTKQGEVKIWNVADGKEIVTFPPHKKAATGIAYSPDGHWLASTSQDERVNVYDPVARKSVGYFDGHSRPTNDVVFAHDNKTVFSASGGRAKGMNEIKIWEAESGDEKATIAKHEGSVSAIALSPDGNTLASGSFDKTVMLWDVSPFVSGEASAEPVIAPKPAQQQTEAPRSSQLNVIATGDEKLRAIPTLKAGIIGLDTSHAIAFTEALNDPKADIDISDCRIVAAYPKGSPDIESSVTRVPGYTKKVQELGVEIVDSIDALIEKVDVVLLETNDGRPHLEQVLKVLKAGKPVFIDKPIAGTLADAIAIFDAAEKYHTPVFSSSSLRYGAGTQEVRFGSIGKVTRAETFSPCHLEKTHPDLYWYGIHGVESLFTLMGTGCQSVKRIESSAESDVVEGKWEGGRVGIFRGDREGRDGYRGTATGEKGTANDVGKYDGYRPLAVEIVKFFRTRKPPVSREETLEIYAFMEAADESKRQGGAEVTLDSVMAKAREEAKKRLAELDK